MVTNSSLHGGKMPDMAKGKLHNIFRIVVIWIKKEIFETTTSKFNDEE